jgi:AcrR family transcriptional regulator
MTTNRSEPSKKRTKAVQRAETMQQILDAAEYLFSKRGFYGVTFKDVADRVGVHTSLFHYYFDSKQELFDAVIARRAPISSERRIAALDQYERDAGADITAEGALRAFIDTDLDLYMAGDEGWHNYMSLGALVSNSPDFAGRVLDVHFDKVVLRLIAVLKRVFPNCPEEDLFWGYHFVTGALMLSLGRTGRIDTLSSGLCKSDDFGAIKDRIATFMAAGFEAICSRHQ